MQPVNGKKTKFKQETKFEHKRSDGTTRRGNGATRVLTDNGKDKRR